ncbi:MAG TPA: LysM peptidoglycan-binding domain-containing protein [Myxococcaceae bacterium]|nr:LysM peptidoglycan-binding domain-containing protein [Myxococcaceae bacterium]
MISPTALALLLALSNSPAAPASDAPPRATPGPEASPATTEDAEDEPVSEELEEMRALEDAVLDPSAKPSPEVLRSVRALGTASPLRARLEDGAELLSGEEPVVDLGLVTDLTTFDVGSVAAEYDIPLEMQPTVAQYIQFFQGPGRKWFRKWMSRSTRYIPMMTPLLERGGLPRDTVYLAMIESGFSPGATSWARAAGPWQFISSTARRFGLRQDFWVDERRDPAKATVAAGRYLNELHGVLGHWYLAWAGYNAGGEKLRRMMQRRGTSDFWALSDGKGLARETKHYVPKLIACALVAKHPRSFGFSDDEFEFQKPFDVDEVPVVEPTDLDVLARAAGTSTETLRELNPELRRWCTPPASAARPYLVKVPRGTRDTVVAALARIPAQERLTYRIHHVRKGDTLSRIALQYHSAPEAILQFNRLRSAKTLRINTELAVPVPSSRALAEAGQGLERQVARARAQGYVAPAPEDEIPAGTRTGHPRALAQGAIKSELVDGKTRVQYGVQNGDSLWTIAQRFAVSVEQLQGWNSLDRRARRGLQIGTVLTVWPGPGAAPIEVKPAVVVATAEQPPPAARPAAPPPPAGGKPGIHQLAEGETLWSIAQQYGVSVEDLKRWNRIRHARALRPGLNLRVGGPPD